MGQVGFLKRLRGEAKLHLLCATNGVPLSYELTPANVAEVRLEVRLTEELLDEANLPDDLARRLRRLFGDLAYRSEALGHALAMPWPCLGRVRDISGDHLW